MPLLKSGAVDFELFTALDFCVPRGSVLARTIGGMGASADLVDAWADLVHGAACVGCGMPGRVWCRSCAAMVDRGVETHFLDVGIRGVTAAYAGDYDGWLRTLILTHKEQSAWSLATPLGALLAHVIRAVALRERWVIGEDDGLMLVPVPSHRRTVRMRGHDPTLRMVREAAASLRLRGIDAQALPLLRLRLPVRDSVGLSAAQRCRNLEDAFAVRRWAHGAVQRPEGTRRIVLCDDVLTTGATMREACAALSLAGMPAAAAVTVAAVGRQKQSS